MEEFLGILFAGGKGTRLGLITDYISKAFVPVYDRPVFMYPLQQLEDSQYINEIIILTRPENDEKLSKQGYETIIQDDEKVSDMFSGLKFIKKVKNTTKHFVLMPCDNISNIKVDEVIDKFLSNPNVDLTFSIKSFGNKHKLKEMGVYDIEKGKYSYKPEAPSSKYGVLAPYVVRNSYQVPLKPNQELINMTKHNFCEYDDFWFDAGDVASLLECSCFVKKMHFNQR